MYFAATKKCESDTGLCSTTLSIWQENYNFKLKSDFSVEFNGFPFDMQQVIMTPHVYKMICIKFVIFQAQAIAANYRDEFEAQKIGDRGIFHSNLFGFTIAINDQGDILIMVIR